MARKKTTKVETSSTTGDRKTKGRLTAVQTTSKLGDRIRGQFGMEAVFREGDERVGAIDWIPTLSCSINDALGGGFAVGRLSEIAGAESSGKTTLALHVVAQAQIKWPDRDVLFVDAENALDLRWARMLGVNTSRLLITQPSNAEETIDIISAALAVQPTKPGEESSLADYPSLIVVDSIAAMVPQAELDGDAGDAQVAELARMLGKGIKKWVKSARATQTHIMLLNQFRDTIGSHGGPKKVTPGGNAPRFYASQRLKVWGERMKVEKDAKPFGLKTHVDVIKNKVAPPFREGAIHVFFDRGVDSFVELLEHALAVGVVVVAGSWVQLQDPAAKKGVVNIGQGKANAVANLGNTPELTERVRELIRVKVDELNAMASTRQAIAGEDEAEEAEG